MRKNQKVIKFRFTNLNNSYFLRLKSVLKIIGLFLLTACAQNRYKPDNYDESIADYFDLSEYEVLNIEYIDTLVLSDIIEVNSMKYIPLETRDDMYIGNISQISMSKDRILLFDRSLSKKVMCFDTLGKFVFEAGGEGKGPGEFIYPTDFFIDKQELIYISDPPTSITSFDKNGKLENQKELPFYIEEMEEFDNSSYLIYGPSKGYSPEISGNSYPYTLFLINKDFTKIKKYYFPYNELDDTLSDNIIDCYNSSFTFARSFYQKFYFINQKGELKPRFYVNFGKYNVPNEILITQNTKMLEEKFFKGEFASSIENIIENEDYFIFQFYIERIDEEHRWLAIHSKKSRKTIATQNVINDIDGGLYEFPKTRGVNNTLVSILYPDRLKEKLAYTKGDSTKKVQNLDSYEELKVLMNTIGYDDNPVLLVYKLKVGI